MTSVKKHAQACTRHRYSLSVEQGHEMVLVRYLTSRATTCTGTQETHTYTHIIHQPVTLHAGKKEPDYVANHGVRLSVSRSHKSPKTTAPSSSSRPRPPSSRGTLWYIASMLAVHSRPLLEMPAISSWTRFATAASPRRASRSERSKPAPPPAASSWLQRHRRRCQRPVRSSRPGKAPS